MTRTAPLLARLVLFAFALCAAAQLPAPMPTPPVPATADDALAAAPEVRIRKLHLVRPDLILYPLFVEVIC